MTILQFLFFWTIASLFFGPIIGKCIRSIMS